LFLFALCSPWRLPTKKNEKVLDNFRDYAIFASMQKKKKRLVLFGCRMPKLLHEMLSDWSNSIGIPLTSLIVTIIREKISDDELPRVTESSVPVKRKDTVVIGINFPVEIYLTLREWSERSHISINAIILLILWEEVRKRKIDTDFMKPRRSSAYPLSSKRRTRAWGSSNTGQPKKKELVE